MLRFRRIAVTPPTPFDGELGIELRYKVAIRYGIEGDLRFISHHDTMRLFARALTRAGLPVKFSEGFNPRPRLSLPLPRPVGIASQCELLVLELGEPIEPETVRARLGAQMPAGVNLLESWRLENGQGPVISGVEYTLMLPPQEARRAAQAIARLIAADTWPVDRGSANGGKAKTIDLRAYLIDASVDGHVLRWKVGVTGRGTARPAELLAASGLDPQAWHHQVRRTAVCTAARIDGDVERAGSHERIRHARDIGTDQPAGPG